jgi:hypothetical protein
MPQASEKVCVNPHLWRSTLNYGDQGSTMSGIFRDNSATVVKSNLATGLAYKAHQEIRVVGS